MPSPESYPIFAPAPGPPQKWTKDVLIQHMQSAMQVELSTIPLYICALNSIIPDNGGPSSNARVSILAVVEQEMLHLSLAGNMLRALGGKQALYDKGFMPTYPSKILYDEIDMQLRAADKKNIENFLKLEAPYKPPVETSHMMFKVNLLPGYRSIGMFYEHVETGIKELWKDNKYLFKDNHDKQFSGADFFNTQMVVIQDERTALRALKTIVDQGEGSIGVPDSHYATFVGLYSERKKWTCYEYIDEPTTDKYKSDPLIYQLSLAFDASYCYLLQVIDRLWLEQNPTVRKHLMRTIHRVMLDITPPLGNLLVPAELSGQASRALL
ncbi:hypothetical protein A0H81_00194 [Grifola frondosa]|uniref:Iminophenyl-pyruvate dimer synthase domain-containing protein n=1 Tax=Grifola frondosa TaxID=5627 RepID=A0A1C7MSC3_GRIFR|nr:hypothetical protein A0H81_00194 [Grifola frondosa]